jgi:lipoate-protein ligase A
VKTGSVLTPYGQLKLITGPNFLDPHEDNSIAPRLLKYSAEKFAGSYARIYRPQRTVAFTSRDISTPGYSEAVKRAEELGFTAVKRSPGGRAVAYHEESVVFDLLSHDPDPHRFINERFEAIGNIFVETFARLGIDTHLGELPREFCPGKYSVVTNRIKLVGTAQRIIQGAWMIGACVIIRNTEPVREVLDHVYRAMNVDMDPGTVGSLEACNPMLTTEDFIESLHETLKIHCELTEVNLLVNPHQRAKDLENA